jgi:protein SCO1/2
MQSSRRQWLTSLAIAPLTGLLSSRAAGQTGGNQHVAPPKATEGASCPAPSGKSAVLRPTAQMLRDMTSTAREKMRRERFPNHTLWTQDNQQVRFYDDLIKDKVVVLNFFYAKCDGICPGVTANLVKVQKLFNGRVGRDLFMYSITLKPEHDTVDVIKDYATMFKAGPGWTFLTGNMQDIDAIRRGMGFAYTDPVVDQDKTQHIGNIRFGNEPSMEWGACPGLLSAGYLVRTISYVLPAEGKRA